MKLIKFYNNDKDSIEFLNKHKGKIVNYRLYNEIENKSYIGTATNLKLRIKGKRYGYVGSLFIEQRHDFIHTIILKFGMENFELTVEKDDFQTIEEAEYNEKLLIEKYNSFYDGYNLTINGKGGTSGTVLISKDGNVIRIKKNELPKYLNLGWKKSSGRLVVTDPNTGKFHRLPKDEASYLIENKGWTLGSKSLITTKNFISISNPLTGETKKINKSEINTYQKIGWTKEFLPNKGRKWMYNPISGETISTKEVDKYLKLGFKFGMKKK